MPSNGRWDLIRRLKVNEVYYFLDSVVHSVPPRAGLGPSENNFLGLPDRDGIANNLCTEQERLTLSCIVTCTWSEGVYLYSQQIIILLRHTKTYATYLIPFLDCWVPVICTGFPSPLLSAMVPFFKHQVLPFEKYCLKHSAAGGKGVAIILLLRNVQYFIIVLSFILKKRPKWNGDWARNPGGWLNFVP